MLSLSSKLNSRVIVGDKALELMKSETFRQEWSELYESCPWATMAQSPDVTYLRCNMYRSNAIPVIVELRDASRMVGLLVLARPVGGKKTLGALCEDGEYHVWIAHPEYAEIIMPEALPALWSNTRLPPLSLNYIPSGTPLEWVGQGRWKSCCKLIPVQTRILRLDDAERVQKFLRTKATLRSQRNQLKRLGQVTFRRVNGIQDFEQVLDRFVEMYSARKLAKVGNTIFDSDPIKRNYIFARQGMSGMQHTTVLELDGKAIAAHIGLEGRPGGVFTLAGITHDPAYEKYSPGSLLLMDLINLLCEEGYRSFDLTPGGDSYKERWGDAYETVHELDIYRSRVQMLTQAALDFSMKGMRKLRRTFE